MAEIFVSTDTALRDAIQSAGDLEQDTIVFEADIDSVLTLSKRNSFNPPAMGSFGYSIEGDGFTISDTRIGQKNVDGQLPISITDLNFQYSLGGAADGSAILRATTGPISISDSAISGSHRGWDGNGNLYMSLTTFSTINPISVDFTLSNVTVDVTGQASPSAFLHIWNNVGNVLIEGVVWNSSGYQSALNLLTFNGSVPLGTYTITGNQFIRSDVTQRGIVRSEGNRLENVDATISANFLDHGTFFDLHGFIGGISFNYNFFNTVEGGYGIRITAPNPPGPPDTPTLDGDIFTGPGLPLKYVNPDDGNFITLEVEAAGDQVTVNSDSFDALTAGGQGDDAISLGADDDWVNGDEGDDVIDAGNGNNYIIGGTGIDDMTAGIGNDVFKVGQAGESAAYTTVAGSMMGETIGMGFMGDPWIMQFGDGVDVVTGFESVVDSVDVITANVAPTNLFGSDINDPLVAGVTYVLYGSWDDVGGVFEVEASGFDPADRDDALIAVGDGSNFSAFDGFVILEDLASALQASNFV